MSGWSVAEFDADQVELCRWIDLDEDTARAHFAWVTQERQNRSDVVRRSRFAALLQGTDVIDAAPLHQSRRAPFLANKRLEHLDVESREQIARLEVLGVELAHAATRRDGRPRVGPVWPAVRAVACELWSLARGATAAPTKRGEPAGWWLAEWTCRCSQVERVRADLHDRCPYHDDPPIPHSPQLVEDA